MLAIGHLGISLLIYAPIAYVLLVSGREKAMATGLVVVLLLTPLPDIDMVLPFVAHRGVTHTFPAAVCLGVVVGIGGWTSSLSSAGSGRDRAAFGFFLGSLSVVSHLLGDVVTPMGIQLMYPVSSTRYTLDLVSAFDLEVNRLLFVLGAVVVWLTLHHGRLQVAAREAAGEPSSPSPAATHRHGSEPGQDRAGHPPLYTDARDRDRSTREIGAPEPAD